MTKKSETVIELGDDEPGASPAPLEEKYKKQMRQIFPQKIELPISTLPQMMEKQIDLSPDFQRRDIWTPSKQSRFIESIIMNVPIPPVFLGEDEYGKYVVLDGRQRLTAISAFMENAYQLEGLRVWDELNDLNYHDLKKKGLESTLLRRFIPAILVLKESSPEVKYDVFDRLNTGGVTAEPMEIRNAIYRGPFNELLHSLSDASVFRKLWNIPIDDAERQKNLTYARMEDLELVLRFFALRDYPSMKGRFKDHLSSFMDKRNKEYKKKPELIPHDTALFTNATSNALQIFDDDAFRRPSTANEKKNVKSAPLADAALYALSEVDTSLLTSSVQQQVRIAFDSLFDDGRFLKSIGPGTNGKTATEYRLETARSVVHAAVGLS